MLSIVIMWLILSPLIPMIYLFYRYFQNGANRLSVEVTMLIVCAVIFALGLLYAKFSHELDGLRALGAVWGGFAGVIVSVIMLIIAVFK